MKNITVLKVFAIGGLSFSLWAGVVSYQASNQTIHQDFKRLKTKRQALSQLEVKVKQAKQAPVNETPPVNHEANTVTHFFNDMFTAIPKLQKQTPTSKYATKSVIAAFLGVVGGGDEDAENNVKYAIAKNSLAYAKSADGTVLGFGDLTFTVNGKPRTLKLLLTIDGQTHKITRLQTGTIKDTSETGANQ